jgi:ABC-type Fe3+ transport system substrate-binding protein
MKTLFAVLISMVFAATAVAQTSDWQKTWDETLAAAKKEGKVVIIGSPDPVMRGQINPKFTERYGIKVEYIAGNSSQLIERIRTERASGLYSTDIYMSGANSTLNSLLPQKMLDPVKPLLILPEVTEGKYWKRGAPFFTDREGQYALALFATVDSFLFINEDYIKPGDLKNVQELLDPKWRGKIVSQDPNLSGTGQNTASYLYRVLGPDFIRKLYIDQKPIISSDRRQMTDWLARGTYPICLSCRVDDTQSLRKDGFKLKEVFSLPGLRDRIIVGSPFLLALANKAPNPNAARVFINWMAGKEAVEIYARNFGSVPLRTDIDESFLNPDSIPKPGVDYIDDTDPEWLTTGRVETAKKVREVLATP